MANEPVGKSRNYEFLLGYENFISSWLELYAINKHALEGGIMFHPAKLRDGCLLGILRYLRLSAKSAVWEGKYVKNKIHEYGNR